MWVVAGGGGGGGAGAPPPARPPAAPTVTKYTSGDGPETGATDSTSQRFSPDANLPPDWWRLFASPSLNDAVRQGLEASPTVAAAEANLRGAQDELRAGQGVFYPQVSAGIDATRERPSRNATPARLNEGVFNLFTASATISYVLDIFGGERRSVEALAASVDYQRNVARAASLTLASNVANTMIASAAYEAEIEATNEIVATEKEQVRLAEVQAKAGTANYAGVLSLQTQLDATQAQLPALRQKLSQSQNLLAVLRGSFPAEAPPVHLEFAELTLPHTLPLSAPSALVRQRPDILEAEAALHAASAEIGVATAAMLPSITLDGSFGLSDTSTRGLLASGSRVWGIGAGLTQPIFRGGTLLSERDAAINAYKASSANYRQTVLVAFEQVADTMRGLEHDAETVEISDRGVHTASRAQSLTQANYKAGLATWSDVLVANAQYHQARIANIEARAAQYQDTVALYAALGGGWWNGAGASATARQSAAAATTSP
ncbi:MAG: efflux transporter outer membrane subunit [Parvibaculum sp.]|uniref:efflux transporter outer membrane subunit n=1 Tax=Parvibaculum sp. TaxID=2024848 RepID=UPI00284AAB0C|nr:efflux transporter outer membrane subunit [Parvibaculum sp.]MDR3500948.1 efflux transporter outer membrane subunit [Parvibaculum sp.]